MPSTDRVSLDLNEHEASQDRRQRSFDSYEAEAERNVTDKLVDEGMSPGEAAAFLLTGDGADLIETEVTRLEEIAEDAHTDAQIDEYRERNR